MMKRLMILSLTALAAFLAAGIVATRADSNGTITLPAPNNTLKDGPNVALAQTKCLICHSAEYIYMQPPLTRKQWTAEVTKMQKTFGAPIADADVAPLVDYLMSQDGKPD
jgi:sulfite dehydrogenase (cytochrome) subunit B